MNIVNHKGLHIAIAPFTPLEYYDSGKATDELHEYDYDRILASGATRAAYWYLNGGYDGSGQIIYAKDGAWQCSDLGHCSCYGPTDDVVSLHGSPYKSLAELLASCSPQLQKWLSPLLAECETWFLSPAPNCIGGGE